MHRVSSRLPYPNFNGFYIDSDFHGYSIYNAGNVKFEHRAGDLAITSVFTWAKSMDNKSATAGAGASGTGYQGFMDNHARSWTTARRTSTCPSGSWPAMSTNCLSDAARNLPAASTGLPTWRLAAGN